MMLYSCTHMATVGFKGMHEKYANPLLTRFYHRNLRCVSIHGEKFKNLQQRHRKPTKQILKQTTIGQRFELFQSSIKQIVVSDSKRSKLAKEPSTSAKEQQGERRTLFQ